MKKIISSLHKQKGQSLVELAIVVLIVLILMAGVLDLGRVFYTYLALFDGAQEGATYASQFPSYCLQINQRVQNSVKDAVKDYATNLNVKVYVNGVLGCQNGAVVDQATLNSACLAKEIKVTVTVPSFMITTPFIGAITGPSISLNAQARNKVLRPPCP